MKTTRQAQRRGGWLVCLPVLLMSLTVPVQGQSPTAPDNAQADPLMGMVIEFDTTQILTERRRMLPDTIRDRIWEIKPSPGRRLVAVPLVIKEMPREPVELSQRTVQLNNAIFVCLRIGDPDELTVEGSYDEEQQKSRLEATVPRVTRSVIITPQGQAQWKLERFIRGGSIQPNQGNDYAYKLSRELLDEKHPGKLPRASRNNDETYSAFVTRSQQERANWQARNAEYRQISDRVNTLPDEFEDDVPPRIWAIYELNQLSDQLEFQGPEPLPWRITLGQLHSLQQLGESVRRDTPIGADSDTLPAEYAEHIAGVLSLVQADGHIYNLRMAAWGVVLSGVTRFATPGDNLYQLLARLGTCEDRKIKQVIVKNLLETFPPTQATTQLLSLTGRDVLDESMKTIRLNNLISGRQKNAESASLQDVLAEANRLMADPQAGAVAATLDTLMDVATKEPAAVGVFVSGVNIAALDDEQLDRFARSVIERAPTQRLAALWLDRQLLGASDPTIQRRTLQMLADADPGAQLVTPVMDTVMGMVFGSSGTRASEPRDAGRVKLTGPIAIESPQHAILRLLQHGDPTIRSLAWQVLPLFRVGAMQVDQATATNTTATDAPAPAPGSYDPIYQLLLDAGLSQSPTPPSLVDFFDRQPDEDIANAALVRLLLRGQAQASARAARVILGSGRNLQSALAALPYGDRHEFGKRMYQNVQQSTPVVCGLLRERSNETPSLAFFSAAIANGQLPESGAWAGAYPDEDALLGMVASSDADLSTAAVAALVASAGGDERAAANVAALFRQIPDQSLENIRQQWHAARRSVFRQRILAAAGAYRMSMAVYSAPFQKGQPLEGLEPTDSAALNIIALALRGEQPVFSGQAISLSIADEQLGIIIDKPSELETLGNETLTAQPFESVSEPAMLLPQVDGSWRADIPLGADRTAVILLRPVGG